MSLRHAVLGALSVRPSSGYELVTRFISQDEESAEIVRRVTDVLLAALDKADRSAGAFRIPGRSAGRDFASRPLRQEVPACPHESDTASVARPSTAAASAP